MNILILSIVVLVYLIVIGGTGYFAWRNTKNSEDFMVAGRSSRSIVLALSYGATFISTGAIVGFGGIAGDYGMGILWLVFLNLFVGIFIAFTVFGKRTRKISAKLGSLTFPEFLGKRFNSKFLQYFGGIVIFGGMPIYASVVLIGAARFMELTLSLKFEIALIIMAIIVAAYVLFGGIKAVMYTDTLQACIMVVSMIILLIFTYTILGGVTQAHTTLTSMANMIPASTASIGGTGWTSFPTFNSPLWWTLVSTIILGVGVGVVAQPQLNVRFMTAKSDKELNRSILIGAIFVFITTFTAYVVGSLSNVYFFQNLGQLATQAVGGNIDNIIPGFINAALPEWFTYLFLLTLLAAAMSTLSSQFHTQGTALGRDIIETISTKKFNSVLITRVGILIGVILALILAFFLPASIVAQGTAWFFGLCAAAFLSVYICALYWKRTTRQGAIAGVISGTLVSLFWMIFCYKKTATSIGICQYLTGKALLLPTLPWPSIDPLIIAVPISLILTIIISLLSKPPKQELIDKCFPNKTQNNEGAK